MASAFDLGTILAREPNGFDNQSGFLKACSQDPGLSDGEIDCRAMGLRPRRLSSWRISAGLGGVERQVPRYGAGFLARRGTGLGAGQTSVRFARMYLITMAGGPGRASISSRPMTASRSMTSSLTMKNTTKPMARTTGTAIRQPFVELRRRRADRRSGDQRTARAADPQPARRRCCFRRARR